MHYQTKVISFDHHGERPCSIVEDVQYCRGMLLITVEDVVQYCVGMPLITVENVLYCR